MTMDQVQQVTRDGKFLVEHRYPLPDLHVFSHRVIQISQTRLAPEKLGYVKHVRYEVYVESEPEEASGELQGISTTQT